jgi:hypothetical protein
MPVPGVESARANLATDQARVRWDARRASTADLVAAALFCWVLEDMEARP